MSRMSRMSSSSSSSSKSRRIMSDAPHRPAGAVRPTALLHDLQRRPVHWLRIVFSPFLNKSLSAGCTCLRVCARISRHLGHPVEPAVKLGVRLVLRPAYNIPAVLFC